MCRARAAAVVGTGAAGPRFHHAGSQSRAGLAALGTQHAGVRDIIHKQEWPCSARSGQLQAMPAASLTCGWHALDASVEPDNALHPHLHSACKIRKVLVVDRLRHPVHQLVSMTTPRRTLSDPLI